jgi:transposase-like protein
VARHPKEFWARLCGEVERGAAIGTVAQRYGVKLSTLRWWRSTLRRGDHSVALRLLPVVVTRAAIDEVIHIDVAVRNLVVRVPVGADIDFAAAFVRALEPC